MEMAATRQRYVVRDRIGRSSWCLGGRSLHWNVLIVGKVDLKNEGVLAVRASRHVGIGSIAIWSKHKPELLKDSMLDVADPSSPKSRGDVPLVKAARTKVGRAETPVHAVASWAGWICVYFATRQRPVETPCLSLCLSLFILFILFYNFLLRLSSLLSLAFETAIFLLSSYLLW